MPKRRRFTPLRYRTKTSGLQNNDDEEEDTLKDKDVSSARGRLMGALMEIIEPTLEESDTSDEYSPSKKEKKPRVRQGSSDDEKSVARPQTQSYVLKLFDRSVDLSQFTDDTPLYPICRAWMANNPKAEYKVSWDDVEEPLRDAVDLPDPEGPPISRIPELLPAQLNASKDNIDLNYEEGPTKQQLLAWHMGRWSGVREAWLGKAAQVHARYADSQQVLDSINVSAM